MITVEGTDRLREVARELRTIFANSTLTALAMKLAADAGEQLKEAIVARCVTEIYDFTGSFTATYERTEALLHSHERLNKGLEQIIRVNPDAEAEPEARDNRELVIDYAHFVHDGYTQWFMGHSTGEYHEGRPWFDDAVKEHGSAVVEYVIRAFEQTVEKAFNTL